MKPQFKIPMKWERGTMFTEAINWRAFHRHNKKHGIKMAGMMLPVGRK